MKIITILMTLFLFLASALSHAQTITTNSLDEAVTNVESAYQAASDLTMNFTQSTKIVMLGKTTTNFGTMSWKKPGKFLIEYNGDEKKIYTCNGKKIWVYTPGDAKPETFNMSDAGVSEDALSFVRGFVDIKKHYRITNWKKKGPKIEMTLTPIFSNAPYTKLFCHFGSNHLLEDVEITSTSGNTSLYKFSNVRINTGLDDSIFEFKKAK